MGFLEDGHSETCTALNLIMLKVMFNNVLPTAIRTSDSSSNSNLHILLSAPAVSYIICIWSGVRSGLNLTQTNFTGLKSLKQTFSRFYHLNKLKHRFNCWRKSLYRCSRGVRTYTGLVWDQDWIKFVIYFPKIIAPWIFKKEECPLEESMSIAYPPPLLWLDAPRILIMIANSSFYERQ